jgi:hypothetical protein
LAFELSFLHSQPDDFGDESALESAVVFTIPLDDDLLDENRGTGQEPQLRMTGRLRELAAGYTWFGSGGSPEDWSWSLQRQW